MAVPTDTSFGAGFPADEFRDAILSVMEMGSPNEEPQKVWFHWPSTPSYSGPVDASGRPFDIHAVPTQANDVKPVQAICGVSWVDRVPTGTAIGQFDNPRVVIEMLDVEYVKVKGATRCTIGENWYKIDYVTPGALFDVDTFKIHATAEDEN